jgi:hypothetical protein
MKWKSLTSQIIAVLFILLWMYAAAGKLVDYEKFQVQLSKSPMLTQFSNITSLLVPAIEIAIALLLFSEKFRLLGLYASLCLMTAFTAYIYAITHYSEVIPCSCGGILEDMTWQQHFVFNIVFLVLSAVAIFFHDPVGHPNEHPPLARSKILFE